MAKCKVCEYCGASLDFGERCDCEECTVPEVRAARKPFGRYALKKAGEN